MQAFANQSVQVLVENWRVSDSATESATVWKRRCGGGFIERVVVCLAESEKTNLLYVCGVVREDAVCSSTST